MEKNIILILSFAVIGVLCDAVSNAAISIIMALGLLYIIIDMCRKRSLAGLALERGLYVPLVAFWALNVVAAVAVSSTESLKFATNYIYWALPMFIMLYLGRKCDLRNSAVLGISLSLICSGGYTINQYLTAADKAVRLAGLQGNPNHYATLLVLLLPIIFCSLVYRRQCSWLLRILQACALLAGLVGLLLTGSRGGILGLLLAGFVTIIIHCIFAKNKVKSLLLILVMLLMGGAVAHFGIPGGSVRNYDEERYYLVEASYNMWNDHKLVGVGFANWKDEYQQKYILPEAKGKRLDMPHNVIAWFFSCAGILGGIGYLLSLFGITRYTLKQLFTNPENFILWGFLWAFGAVTLHGMVDVGITMKSAARLFYALLGLAIASSSWQFGEK